MFLNSTQIFTPSNTVLPPEFYSLSDGYDEYDEYDNESDDEEFYGDLEEGDDDYWDDSSDD